MYHAQLQPLGGVADEVLPAVEQGAYLGDPRPVQVGDRLEAGQPPLEDQGHEECLHRVVVVVAQGDFGYPPLLEGGVEGAPAHLGAQGAGVLLLPGVEYDPANLGGDHCVGHTQLLAQPGHRLGVGPLAGVGRAQVQGDGFHRKGDGVELPQLGQGHQQHQGVLPPRHPHRNPVAVVDHIVVLHTPPGEGKNFVHRPLLLC